ncbi:cathepsin L [Trifolium repens]|nr:cathepsin L [Trifolium repens]
MIKRREIFKKNLLYIQKFNSQGILFFSLLLCSFSSNVICLSEYSCFYTSNNTYRLAINKFADINKKDMSSCVQEDPSDLLASEKIVSFNISEEGVPDSFDWRDHNAVSPVRNERLTQ